MGSSENKQAAATFSFQIRTDLALEDKESFEGDGGEIPGVVLKERTRKEGAVRMTEVKILNAQGARAMGKPEGTYLTLEADELQTPDEDCHSRVVDELAMQLNELMKRAGWEKKENPSLLVVGLGNQSVTPDSLGPRTVGNLRVTGHLLADRTEKKQPYPCLCAIAPGVMAQTGMETAQILHGIIGETSPDLVIAIDALAARSVRRLCTTIQLTDTGIHPGSGVGNHRNGLTEENLQVKVIGIGVPTVVDAATIVHDSMEHLLDALEETEQKEFLEEMIAPNLYSMFVTPKDVDETVKYLSFTISEGLNIAFSEV